MATFASFARCLRKLHIQGYNNIILYQPLSGSSLTPKRMTLNDLEWSFCVKIWSELGIQCAGVLAFGEKCSDIQSYAFAVSGKKCSPARDCTGDVRVMELFTGITEQPASNQ